MCGVCHLIPDNRLVRRCFPICRATHTKHLRVDLWEIRLIGASARTIYVTVTGQTIVVVHLFFKKTQKTPKHALTVALQRMKDILK